MAQKNDYTAGWFLAAYSASNSSYSWATIGSTRDGWTVHQTFHEQDVHDDRFGDGRADTVQQGVDYEVSGIMLNLNAAVASGVFNAQESEGNTNNNVGLLGSTLYGALCLTPLAGTPAASLLGGGMSYLFYIAAIANNVDRLLSSKLREIPVTFKTIPSQPNSNKCYVIAATPAGVPSTYP